MARKKKSTAIECGLLKMQIDDCRKQLRQHPDLYSDPDAILEQLDKVYRLQSRIALLLACAYYSLEKLGKRLSE